MDPAELDVVVAGHLCLDLIPGFAPDRAYTMEGILSPGRLLEVRALCLGTGGPVSNTGIPLVKLGMKVAFLAKVGDDEIGRLTLKLLKRWGNVSGIGRSADVPSSYSVVLALPGIDRIFLHCPGANDTLRGEDIDAAVCGKARLFHLGYPPLMRSLYENGGEELARIYRRIKALGLTTSMDMAWPDPGSDAGRMDWRPLFEGVLPHVDLFAPSVEEALYMADPERWQALSSDSDGDLLDRLEEGDFTALSQKFLDWGAAIVGLKAGHRGFYLRTAGRERIEQCGRARPHDFGEWSERELWMPAYCAASIASTTGAGDCSLAGFLAAFLRGETPERCLAAATALGYQNLASHDAVSGVLDWNATLAMIEDRALTRYPHQLSRHWRVDADRQVAHGIEDRQR